MKTSIILFVLACLCLGCAAVDINIPCNHADWRLCHYHSKRSYKRYVHSVFGVSSVAPDTARAVEHPVAGGNSTLVAGVNSTFVG